MFNTAVLECNYDRFEESFEKLHLQWCRSGIYDLAYKACLRHYLKLCKFKRSELKNLFIEQVEDLSMIKKQIEDLTGVDVVGKNHYEWVVEQIKDFPILEVLQTKSKTCM